MAIRIDEIVAKGVAKGTEILEKKFMGGVTAESAQRAIEKSTKETAQEVERQMNEVAQRGVEEINRANEQAMATLKNTHLREMADKDRKLLSLQEANEAVTKDNAALETKLAKFMSRLEKALTFKEIQTLEDGSKIYEKHSLNGAKALKTVNKEGITIQLNVELADKTFRCTTYNPLTGKPTRTVTNATKDGKTVEVLYNDYGIGGKPKVLNARKAGKAEPPKVVNRVPKVVSENTVEVETLYSDGSKIKSEVDRQTNEVRSWTKWNKADDWSWDEYYVKDKKYGITKGKKIWNEGRTKLEYEKRINIMPSGIRTVSPYARHEDELTGLITEVTRMTFPKSSPVKRIDAFAPQGRNTTKAVVRMKDGTIYELTNFKEVPSNRELRPGGGLEVDAPQSVVKVTKDGTRTEMAQSEIMPWLESFHPGYNFNLMQKL